MELGTHILLNLSYVAPIWLARTVFVFTAWLKGSFNLRFETFPLAIELKLP